MSTKRTDKLELRLTRAAMRTIQNAATASQMAVGDFVLESALTLAETIAAERSTFRLDSKRWREFQAALDAPPRQRPRLARLFNESSILG